MKSTKNDNSIDSDWFNQHSALLLQNSTFSCSSLAVSYHDLQSKKSNYVFSVLIQAKIRAQKEYQLLITRGLLSKNRFNLLLLDQTSLFIFDPFNHEDASNQFENEIKPKIVKKLKTNIYISTDKLNQCNLTHKECTGQIVFELTRSLIEHAQKHPQGTDVFCQDLFSKLTRSGSEKAVMLKNLKKVFPAEKNLSTVSTKSIIHDTGMKFFSIHEWLPMSLALLDPLQAKIISDGNRTFLQSNSANLSSMKMVENHLVMSEINSDYLALAKKIKENNHAKQFAKALFDVIETVGNNSNPKEEQAEADIAVFEDEEALLKFVLSEQKNLVFFISIGAYYHKNSFLDAQIAQFCKVIEAIRRISEIHPNLCAPFIFSTWKIKVVVGDTLQAYNSLKTQSSKNWAININQNNWLDHIWTSTAETLRQEQARYQQQGQNWRKDTEDKFKKLINAGNHASLSEIIHIDIEYLDWEAIKNKINENPRVGEHNFLEVQKKLETTFQRGARLKSATVNSAKDPRPSLRYVCEESIIFQCIFQGILHDCFGEGQPIFHHYPNGIKKIYNATYDLIKRQFQELQIVQKAPNQIALNTKLINRETLKKYNKNDNIILSAGINNQSSDEHSSDIDALANIFYSKIPYKQIINYSKEIIASKKLREVLIYKSSKLIFHDTHPVLPWELIADNDSIRVDDVLKPMHEKTKIVITGLAQNGKSIWAKRLLTRWVDNCQIKAHQFYDYIFYCPLEKCISEIDTSSISDENELIYELAIDNNEKNLFKRNNFISLSDIYNAIGMSLQKDNCLLIIDDYELVNANDKISKRIQQLIKNLLKHKHIVLIGNNTGVRNISGFTFTHPKQLCEKSREIYVDYFCQTNQNLPTEFSHKIIELLNKNKYISDMIDTFASLSALCNFFAEKSRTQKYIFENICFYKLIENHVNVLIDSYLKKQQDNACNKKEVIEEFLADIALKIYHHQMVDVSQLELSESQASYFDYFFKPKTPESKHFIFSSNILMQYYLAKKLYLHYSNESSSENSDYYRLVERIIKKNEYNYTCELFTHIILDSKKNIVPINNGLLGFWDDVVKHKHSLEPHYLPSLLSMINSAFHHDIKGHKLISHIHHMTIFANELILHYLRCHEKRAVKEIEQLLEQNPHAAQYCLKNIFQQTAPCERFIVSYLLNFCKSFEIQFSLKNVPFQTPKIFQYEYARWIDLGIIKFDEGFGIYCYCFFNEFMRRINTQYSAFSDDYPIAHEWMLAQNLLLKLIEHRETLPSCANTQWLVKAQHAIAYNRHPYTKIPKPDEISAMQKMLILARLRFLCDQDIVNETLHGQHNQSDLFSDFMDIMFSRCIDIMWYRVLINFSIQLLYKKNSRSKEICCWEFHDMDLTLEQRRICNRFYGFLCRHSNQESSTIEGFTRLCTSLEKILFNDEGQPKIDKSKIVTESYDTHLECGLKDITQVKKYIKDIKKTHSTYQHDRQENSLSCSSFEQETKKYLECTSLGFFKRKQHLKELKSRLFHDDNSVKVGERVKLNT